MQNTSPSRFGKACLLFFGQFSWLPWENWLLQVQSYECAPLGRLDADSSCVWGGHSNDAFDANLADVGGAKPESLVNLTGNRHFVLWLANAFLVAGGGIMGLLLTSLVSRSRNLIGTLEAREKERYLIDIKSIPRKRDLEAVVGGWVGGWVGGGPRSRCCWWVGGPLEGGGLFLAPSLGRVWASSLACGGCAPHVICGRPDGNRRQQDRAVLTRCLS
jgi:hypothetical protein